MNQCLPKLSGKNGNSENLSSKNSKCIQTRSLSLFPRNDLYWHQEILLFIQRETHQLLPFPTQISSLVLTGFGDRLGKLLIRTHSLAVYSPIVEIGKIVRLMHLSSKQPI